MSIAEQMEPPDEVSAFNELPHVVQYSDHRSGIGYFPDLVTESLLHGFSWDGLNYSLSRDPEFPSEASTQRIVKRREDFFRKLGMIPYAKAAFVETSAGNTSILDTRIRCKSSDHRLKAGAVFTETSGLSLYTIAGDCSWSIISGQADYGAAVTGLVHIGRREAEANFAGDIVDHLATAYGCDPSGLRIGITPSLGSEHHVIKEADVDVHISNLAIWGDASYRDEKGDLHLDQSSLIAQQYAKAGVAAEHVNVSRTDTYQNNFGEEGISYSYRYATMTGKRSGRFLVATQILTEDFNPE